MYCPARASIVAFTELKRERRLPIAGEVLVAVGDSVEPADIIARGPQKSETCVIDVAKSLSVSEHQAGQYMQKEIGDTVEIGEVIAAKKGPIGLLGKTCRAPVSGSIIAINRGQVLLQSMVKESRETAKESELPALIRGKVVEIINGYGAVIETKAGLIEGIWGWGGASTGLLKVLVNSRDEPLTTAAIDIASQGHILVGGTSIDQAALLRAAEVKVSGIVVGSVHASLAELEPKLPYPVLITEGLGQVPMAAVIFELLRSYDGEMAYIRGPLKSDGRQKRPELLIFPATRGQVTPVDRSTLLQEGTTVRVTREPYMGRVGKVKSIPNKSRLMESGIALRSAEIDLGDGERVFVPIANLERIN
jgi:transcription antitermination factor NusG